MGNSCPSGKPYKPWQIAAKHKQPKPANSGIDLLEIFGAVGEDGSVWHRNEDDDYDLDEYEDDPEARCAHGTDFGEYLSGGTLWRFW